MKKIGIFIETKANEIKPAMFGAISAAQGDEHELYALVADGQGTRYREQLKAFGIHKVIDIQRKGSGLVWNPDLWARAVIQALEQFEIEILFGLTSLLGKDILPRIAAALEAPLLLDCLKVDLENATAEKYQFSGKTIATFKFGGDRLVFGIRPNVVDPRPMAVENEVVTFACDVPDESRFEVLEVRKGQSSGVDLAEADIIISGGRAMANPENFEILRECAKVLGAAVGASRVAVDSGWVPHTMQVGQTGTTVCPKLYIACGISGAVQHFAGMKTAEVIVAINTDPDAPLMQGCDYGIVGDLFEVLPELTRQLKEATGNA
jgi:electron transfer flavoprotein alpha subunit